MISRLKRSLHILFALLVAVFFVLPLFWAVVVSLRQPGLPPVSTIEWWPQAAHWDNYAEIFRLLPMARYLQNSVIVVAVAVPVTLLYLEFHVVRDEHRLPDLLFHLQFHRNLVQRQQVLD